MGGISDEKCSYLAHNGFNASMEQVECAETCVKSWVFVGGKNDYDNDSDEYLMIHLQALDNLRFLSEIVLHTTPLFILVSMKKLWIGDLFGLRQEVMRNFNSLRAAFGSRHYVHSETINPELQTITVTNITSFVDEKHSPEDHFWINESIRFL